MMAYIVPFAFFVAVLCAPLSISVHNHTPVVPQVDERTTKNIQNVDYHLKMVVIDVYSTCSQPFIVIDGLRTLDEQKEHLKNGATTTLNSRHLTGHAIDFVITSFDWNDIDAFKTVGKCFKQHEGIEWGGDWKTFKDYGHIQISRKST